MIDYIVTQDRNENPKTKIKIGLASRALARPLPRPSDNTGRRPAAEAGGPRPAAGWERRASSRPGGTAGARRSVARARGRTPRGRPPSPRGRTIGPPAAGDRRSSSRRLQDARGGRPPLSPDQPPIVDAARQQAGRRTMPRAELEAGRGHHAGRRPRRARRTAPRGSIGAHAHAVLSTRDLALKM